ncbi:MAG: translation initiation factor IF-6 [Desulfurococcaceae archaeon]|uniref:Translation initiation factor 6 n=1 Tax=Staphylothermus marinus TaxID=2280 RepID=A0A7C4H8R4_STAMA
MVEVNKIRIFGSPHIGVYVFVNNMVAIIPPGLENSVKEIISNSLNVDLIETKIADLVLNGVLIAGNDHGVVLPRNTRESEIEYIRKKLSKYGINVYVSRSKNTALGNVLLVNNKACIISLDFEKDEIINITDTLGVEVFQRNILNLSIPGSLAVITDNGGVVHPDVSDEDLEDLKKIFNIYIERATVNSGIPFIKSGLIANNKGVLVGENTTGPEILRIQKGFTG